MRAIALPALHSPPRPSPRPAAAVAVDTVSRKVMSRSSRRRRRGGRFTPPTTSRSSRRCRRGAPRCDADHARPRSQRGAPPRLALQHRPPPSSTSPCRPHATRCVEHWLDPTSAPTTALNCFIQANARPCA
ncbi:hypothetical protein ACP70R_025222 [Stipagrostis hirtigluma subsp. patula]